MQDLKRITAKFSNQLKKGQKEPDFFYLLRLIENQLSDHPRIGYAKRPDDEAVRFGQMPYLHFPETTIHSITETHRNSEFLTVLVYFFGLLGPNGPMPLELTNYIYQRNLHSYDAASRRFLDMINHRFLSLFYRAFSVNEFALQYDRNDNLINDILSAMTRCGYSEHQWLSELVGLSMTGRLFSLSRSRRGLEKTLCSFFDVPIVVEELVKKAHIIPKHYRMRLGDRRTSCLGLNAQIGERYIARTQDLSVVIGPVSYGESMYYMPRKPYFKQLCNIVRMYLNHPVYLTVVLKIDASTIRPLKLDCSMGLGQGTHLISVASKNSVITVNINVSSIAKHTEMNLMQGNTKIA